MIINILLIWLYAGIFSAILAMFRSDFADLYDGFIAMFMGLNFMEAIVTVLYVYICLPLVIFFTIQQLWRKK